MWHFFIFKLHHIKLFINFLFYQLLMCASTIFPTSRFRNIHLFYANIHWKTTANAKQIDCFNTVSVLIQLHLNKTFYESVIVSIQLLFLFNQHFQVRTHPLNLFQYSFCSYSTMIWWRTLIILICFNTASVLIQRFNTKMMPIGILFQYSFCSYSTFC